MQLEEEKTYFSKCPYFSSKNHSILPDKWGHHKNRQEIDSCDLRAFSSQIRSGCFFSIHNFEAF